jgi:hypothetical protein
MKLIGIPANKELISVPLLLLSFPDSYLCDPDNTSEPDKHSILNMKVVLVSVGDKETYAYAILLSLADLDSMVVTLH